MKALPINKICFILFVCCFLQVPCVEGRDKVKVGILKFTVSKNIDAVYGDVLYDLFLEQVISSGKVSVVDCEEINRVSMQALSFQPSLSKKEAKQWAMNRLGIEKLYTGTLAKMGKKFYVNVKVLNFDMAVERVLRESVQSEDGLEQSINSIVDQLLMPPELITEHENKEKLHFDIKPEKELKFAHYFIPVSNAQYAPLIGLSNGSREAQEKQKKAVERTGYPLEVKTKKTGIHFRLVPAGTFVMGSPPSESHRDKDEGTLHKVTISKPFYMSKYEITQGQWEAVMGNNPSRFKGSGKDAPVETVSWNDCQKYSFMLSQREDAPPHVFRLPTEAQWEYACRAGTISPYVGDIHFIGWYDENSGKKTHPVGLKSANAWGLFDMMGNVYEWCQDWYRDRYLSEDAKDPTGPQIGEYRVIRGGSWFNDATYFRSANRGRYSADHHRELIGLRLVVFPDQ